MKLKDSNIESIVIGSKNSRQFSVSNNKVIFDVLRNKLYSDPLASICREIASNSRDANRESGRKHIPIQIKMTESFDQLGIAGDLAITFKDSGPGISPDRMDQIFLVYGESTKTATNDLTGGYGLGAKTPFAYSDTFSVSTICEKDGVRTKYRYVAAIDEEEKGTMHLFRETATDEETGTEITIPIKKQDRARFEAECVYYTMHWEVVPQYVNFNLFGNSTEIAKNQMECDRFKFEGFEIRRLKNSVPSFGRHSHRDLKILVDGIPYSCITPHPSADIVLPFENGLFDLAAGRESIQNTPENVKLIDSRMKVLKDFSEKWIKEYFEKMPTYSQAIVSMHLLLNRGHATLPVSDEEYLASVFYSVLEWSGQSNNQIKWKGRNLREHDFKFIKLYDQEGRMFFYYSRKKTYKSEDTDFVNAYIRFRNVQDNITRPDVYLLDTEDKQTHRVWTLLKNDENITQPSNKKLLMYKVRTIVDYVKEEASGFGIYDWEETKKIDEAYIEKRLKENGGKNEFALYYNQYLKDYDKDLEKELKLLEELFTLKKLSDVEPTKVIREVKKKLPDHPVNIYYRAYRMDGVGTELEYTSHVASVIKSEKKTPLKNTVAFKAHSLSVSESSQVNYDMLKNTLLVIRATKRDFKTLASSVNYNNMVAHGSVPYLDFFKSLTQDDFNAVKKLIGWTYVSDTIVQMAHCKELKMSASDMKILERIKIEDFLPKIKDKEKTIDFIGSIRSFAAKFRDARQKDILEIGADNHSKMLLSAAEIKDLRDIDKKYPILTMIELDPNQIRTDVLNDYFSMVNAKQDNLKKEIQHDALIHA